MPLREVGGGWGRLPHEKYCFTGVGYGMKEEWDSEGEADGHAAVEREGGVDLGKEKGVDMEKEGGADLEMGEGEAEEEGDGRMEDLFGEDGGGDKEMEDH